MKKLLLAGVLAALCAAGAWADDVADGYIVTLYGVKIRPVSKDTAVEIWGTGVNTFTATDGQMHDKIGANRTIDDPLSVQVK